MGAIRIYLALAILTLPLPVGLTSRARLNLSIVQPSVSGTSRATQGPVGAGARVQLRPSDAPRAMPVAGAREHTEATVFQCKMPVWLKESVYDSSLTFRFIIPRDVAKVCICTPLRKSAKLVAQNECRWFSEHRYCAECPRLIACEPC